VRERDEVRKWRGMAQNTLSRTPLDKCSGIDGLMVQTANVATTGPAAHRAVEAREHKRERKVRRFSSERESEREEVTD
jgi:hypothetical protein